MGMLKVGDPPLFGGFVVRVEGVFQFCIAFGMDIA
jgi:hypothetical protein